MTLDTLIQTALLRPAPDTRALVLMGGGARTAYQAGVLRALARCMGGDTFPFDILLGTSAGALNATYLATQAADGAAAFERLAGFWSELRSSAVYELHLPSWTRPSRLATALHLWRQGRRQGAILDTTPLARTLEAQLSMGGLERALRSRAIEALAVTASSYSTGVHWTFCHTARDGGRRPWNSPGRRGEFQAITAQHLLASAAIPFLFPSVPIEVDGRTEHFGDGSMRQISPLSPALRLGAGKLLVIGVGQPEPLLPNGPSARPPGFGTIAGHALGSVFHDAVRADVEQARRVTRALSQLPPRLAAAVPYRPVEVLSIQPSRSLDALALEHLADMPAPLRSALRAVGALGPGAPLASYLMFEPPFVRALIALGERDAAAQGAQLRAFFEPARTVARA
ncbi:patatin-like phospholipase family protein [Ramlibacter rhizophilus]|uniref:Patatin n=1 Tax=Ramlibacter rhizophilus TaxID=1781167 RepID=A0A4Z0BI45_9BURK|nr:patatin-like phospholipase family protein [Ramlibacter rhizophilus]TFY98079.1 patatin [Ramlibacter rhizophilus]